MPAIDKYLNNPQFCLWALGETKEALYWDHYIKEHPEEKELIEKAISILHKVQVKEPVLTDEHIQTLWKTISAQSIHKTNTRTFPVWTYAVASSIVFLLVSTFVYFQFFKTFEIQTQFAEQKTHTLPDGSEIWINAGSEISYDPDTWLEKREIFLEGEAYFEVEKGNTFTVNTPKGSVVVLGTRFNVFARSNTFNVACYSGKVKVESPNQESVVLIKGEKAVLSQKLQKENTVETSTPLWKEGHFQFVDMPLQAVFEEVERQFNIKIHFQDKSKIENRRYTGTFSNKNLEICLEVVCQPMGLNYTIHAQEVTIQ